MLRRLLTIHLLLVLVLSGCGRSVANYPNHGKNIICFGDSIIKGLDTDALSELTGYPVINRGINGQSTVNAVNRIDDAVLSKNPYMVIIELGAADSLHNSCSEELTMLNLEFMVKRTQLSGAIAVLCNVGDGSGNPEYDFYSRRMKELARETRSLYVGELLKGIRTNPELMRDFIHPNKEGYKIITERIYKVIKRYL